MSEAGTKEAGPRSMGEIQDEFAQMLTGTDEQTQEDSFEEEQPIEDSLDEGHEEDAELADDSVVDEDDEEGFDDEQPEKGVPTFTVSIGGETMEVPLDELIKGYQLESSFTKKSQELAQQREGFGAEQQVLRQTYQKYTGVLDQLLQQMQAANQPADLDWNALERDNPIQWMKLKMLERDKAGEIQAVQAEQARMQQLLAEQNNQKRQERLAVQRTLVLEKIPEWADGDLQADEQRKLVEFGKGIGFSDIELDNLEDHRALIVLRDAMRYNELTNGEKVTAAKSKIGSVKGGNKTIARHTRSRRAKAKRAKLKATGKVDDAAAIFAEILAE